MWERCYKREFFLYFGT
jgi:GNAT superfamily N-acetyltransferase